eukprot:4678213-Pleurochrysis_carterae.AAC.2
MERRQGQSPRSAFLFCTHDNHLHQNTTPRTSTPPAASRRHLRHDIMSALLFLVCFHTRTILPQICGIFMVYVFHTTGAHRESPQAFADNYVSADPSPPNDHLPKLLAYDMLNLYVSIKWGTH